MSRDRIAAAVLALAAALLIAPPKAGRADYDERTGLFVAPGMDQVAAHCTPCHSARLVTQQGQTRDGWLQLIEWMQEEQGLWPIPEESLNEMLAYLAEHYGPGRPHYGGGTPSGE